MTSVKNYRPESGLEKADGQKGIVSRTLFLPLPLGADEATARMVQVLSPIRNLTIWHRI
jgi:hypothetical protein